MWSTFACTAVCRAARPSLALASLPRAIPHPVRTYATDNSNFKSVFGQELSNKSPAAQAWNAESSKSWGKVNVPRASKKIYTNEEIWSQRHKLALSEKERLPPAGPYAGRSFEVSGNFAEMYRRLNSRLNQNQVKRELRLVRRYEKPGYKRRRLSSERWRKSYSAEVRSKVRLVNTIRHRKRTGLRG